MAEVYLRAIGRALPSARFAQQDLLAHSPWGRNPLLERLFLTSAIHTRAFVVPPTFFTEARSLTDTNDAWLRGALALATASLRRCLAVTDYGPSDIDFIGVTTVTGYATPGLDLLLARQEGLRPDIQRAHFNCMGCHAAIPLLRVARDHLLAGTGRVAIAGAVEVCSACFRLDDDPENIVATSLFADGSAFALLDTTGPGPALLDFGTRFDYAHLDALGFGLDARGFRIVLDPTIPDRIGANVRAAVDDLLGRWDLTIDDVALWAFHPGGAKILDAVQHALGLSDEQLLPSRRVLRAHGNMSSPSVLFSLAEALHTADRGFGVLAAFGPGLGIELALLRLG